MKKPKAILFDADGVIQKRSILWREALGQFVHAPDQVDDFLADIFAAEKPCLTGHGEFENAISQVLEKWGIDDPLAETLNVWTLIEQNEEILNIALKLKAQILICLATNQNPYRADYMASQLGYNEVFDHSFYSCRMGKIKPGNEFFKEITDQLNLPGGSLLFIDDHKENVEAAREAGLNAEVFHMVEGTDRLKNLLVKFGINIPSV